MVMRVLLLLGAFGCLLVAVLAGCHGFSAADAASLRSAQEQSFQNYDIHVDGGSPSRALARGSFCSVNAVLLDLGAATFDAGDAIVCQKPKP